MNEAGLAECIVRAVNSCHPYLHPVLYERWFLEAIKISIFSTFYEMSVFRKVVSFCFTDGSYFVGFLQHYIDWWKHIISSIC